eukprot:GILK01004769.1.p1 GENE.GILK01004769.1~~GILK01004769.1.p1  ORF type:complete len:305 (+),score=35.96 GILK01004769.1:1152-2066(+)
MPEAKQRHIYEGLTRALQTGIEILKEGGSSLDAVEAAVRVLEDDSAFNAGKGAVLTDAGTFELEASVMDGATLACGSVTGCKTVKNPISLARLVMEKTSHIMLGADGAEQFATDMGVERVPQDYFRDEARFLQWFDARKKVVDGQTPLPVASTEGAGSTLGTVGAVARDMAGRVAVATSTGGRQMKKVGRIGDTPLIGAGSYANAMCAVSGTGHGEEFIRHAVAHDVCARVRYQNLHIVDAVKAALNDMGSHHGGLIAVDAKGTPCAEFGSSGMYRGIADSNGVMKVGIWEEMIDCSALADGSI